MSENKRPPGRPRTNQDLSDIETDVPIINELSEEALRHEEPPDIENFLAELGIHNKQYKCQIKQFPAEGGGMPAFLPSNYKGSYPNIEELGTKYGPGKYLYVFTWRIPNPEGSGNKTTMRELEVILGDAWQDAHEEYLYQYSIKRRQRLRSLKNKAEMDNILYGDDKKPSANNNGLDSLLDAKNQLMSLGVPVGSSGTDLATKDQTGIFALVMQMQSKSTELMVTMMNNSQQQMMSLVTAVLANNSQNQTPYTQMFKEVSSMMTNMVGLKEALNPEKQTVVDKIFNLMEAVSPQILQMLQMSAAQRRSNSIYQAAAKSPELQQLKGDPAMTDELARKLDSHYGVQNTNDIMAVMGLERSDGMKMALKNAGYTIDPRQTTQTDEIPPDAVDAEVTDVDEQPGADDNGQTGDTLPDVTEDLDNLE